MAGLDLSMLSRKPAAGGGKAPAADPPVAEPTKDAASTGRHNNNTSSTDDFGAPPPEYEDVFDDYGFGSYAEYDDMTAVSGSSMMSVLGTNNSNNNHHHGTKETEPKTSEQTNETAAAAARPADGGLGLGLFGRRGPPLNSNHTNHNGPSLAVDSPVPSPPNVAEPPVATATTTNSATATPEAVSAASRPRLFAGVFGSTAPPTVQQQASARSNAHGSTPRTSQPTTTLAPAPSVVTPAVGLYGRPPTDDNNDDDDTGDDEGTNQRHASPAGMATEYHPSDAPAMTTIKPLQPHTRQPPDGIDPSFNTEEDSSIMIEQHPSALEETDNFEELYQAFTKNIRESRDIAVTFHDDLLDNKVLVHTAHAEMILLEQEMMGFGGELDSVLGELDAMIHKCAEEMKVDTMDTSA